MGRGLRFVLPLVLSTLAGLGFGRLLEFTLFQRVTLAFSLCLFAVWLLSLVGPFPVFGYPPVEMDARPFPRFISAFASALPAAPYGVTSFGGLVAGR